MSSATVAAVAAQACRRATLAGVCDEMFEWQFGTVARAHHWPGFYEYNTVIVDRPTGMSALDLEVVADGYLADVAHRRFDIEDRAEAVRLRSEFERLGWETLVVVWMLHGDELPPEVAPPGGLAIEEVPWDDVIALRREWHEEDFPGRDPTEYHGYIRELAAARSARVLAVCEDGRPIGFSELETIGGGIEVSAAFVTRERRGEGIGTALTTAALRAGAETGLDVWICADDEDRPKRLYERLGFRPVWWLTQFLRLPPV